ncbi:serine protease [Flavobacterium sp. HXWNR69]|uniref:Serine protease n=1 Tax=Flavobacterium fragile TaxID=2949085 RepID=A0ABT0TGT9_9FLAO|nr:serine protease [Flavobacterium sp. HXWNR69]MCL9770197.1 serine protease [Flavobacterium sp. HXWNR69]
MIFQRDALGNVICNIRIPNAQGEEVGTAIFIEKNNEPYLLTAEHVVKNINPQTYAVLSDQNGVPTKVMLNVLLGGATFTYHGQADLAKAKIVITAANSSFLQGRCFPYNQIDTSTNPVSKDVELTTIGFPLGLGAVGAKFSPLSYRTYAAAPSITLPRFDNQVQCDFIILELPSIGGYSGGPMFDLGYMISGMMTQTKEKTILHGLVHGTISDPTGGKLAAITPCKYLNGWL